MRIFNECLLEIHQQLDINSEDLLEILQAILKEFMKEFLEKSPAGIHVAI